MQIPFTEKQTPKSEVSTSLKLTHKVLVSNFSHTEGAFYVWTRKEFDMILGEQEASICARYWNVHRDGNVDPAQDPHDEFIAQNVLSVVSSVEKLSQMYGMSAEKIKSIIDGARKKLLNHRLKERPRPNLDDKIITSWNGLAITGLAKAAAILGEVDPVRAMTCARNAEEAVTFIRKNLYNERTGVLKRVYREGPGETPGFADDYAFLISGLLHLYVIAVPCLWVVCLTFFFSNQVRGDIQCGLLAVGGQAATETDRAFLGFGEWRVLFNRGGRIRPNSKT